MNKNVLRNMTYGMYLISTWGNGKATGCIANSVIQITSDPITVAVSINHKNYTNSCMKNTNRFAVHILGQNIKKEIIGVFGYQTGEASDKFSQIGGYEVSNMLPVLKEHSGVLICEVVSQMETDTHTIFLGKAIEIERGNQDEPMTYSYYHNVIKGKSPKNAPTYLNEEN